MPTSIQDKRSENENPIPKKRHRGKKKSSCAYRKTKTQSSHTTLHSLYSQTKSHWTEISKTTMILRKNNMGSFLQTKLSVINKNVFNISEQQVFVVIE